MKDNAEYHNMYISDTDLIEFDFYILRIEPDDGDPAPATHILERTILKE